MRTIDLNADLGEGGTEDQAILDLVSSANIACGGHAGDEEIMRRTIQWALASGVAIGAHPGYEDQKNFGRLAVVMPDEEVTNLVRKQVGKLASIAQEAGAQLHHVKLHGALYNQANRDPSLAAAAVKGMAEISINLILYALPEGILAAAGRAAGLTVCGEGFADRRYRDDGSLMPRTEPGALISNVEDAVAQAMKIISNGKIETLCVHGDGPRAVEILRAVRAALGEKELTVRCKTRNRG
jgi:5-oxoprolinase (ATP-hydrolysing) subunit A